jgi:NAD(P)-dependent dehydrogenase (short-subunit alcohol dehydrogenase family)
MQLKGKTAIVTGSGRGIGFGIANSFAKEGANVVICDMSLDNAKEAVKTIEGEGGVGIPFKANVTAKAELDAMVTATVQKFGSLDILVNNAGIESTPSLLKDISEAQWDRVLAVNLKGVFLCCQAVIPQMMKQKKGRIINISSIAGIKMTFFGSADYTASKHGGIGLTVRAVGLLGGMLTYAKEMGYIEHNPAHGIRKPADKRRSFHLAPENYRTLEEALEAAERRREHWQAIAAIKLLALTGCRRSEILNLRWSEVDFRGSCLRLGDTKTGASIRPLPAPMRVILANSKRDDDYVFPA